MNWLARGAGTGRGGGHCSCFAANLPDGWCFASGHYKGERGGGEAYSGRSCVRSAVAGKIESQPSEAKSYCDLSINEIPATNRKTAALPLSPSHSYFNHTGRYLRIYVYIFKLVAIICLIWASEFCVSFPISFCDFPFLPISFYFRDLNAPWLLLLLLLLFLAACFDAARASKRGERNGGEGSGKCARCARIMRTSGWKCLTRIKAKCSQLAQHSVCASVCVCKLMRVCVSATLVLCCVCRAVDCLVAASVSAAPAAAPAALAFGAKFENNLQWRHHGM